MILHALASTVDFAAFEGLFEGLTLKGHKSRVLQRMQLLAYSHSIQVVQLPMIQHLDLP